jgi:hypothetical protein
MRLESCLILRGQAGWWGTADSHVETGDRVQELDERHCWTEGFCEFFGGPEPSCKGSRTEIPCDYSGVAKVDHSGGQVGWISSKPAGWG